MTNEELVALASKCILMNPQFQLHNLFNEDSWFSIGEGERKKAGQEVWQIKNWKQFDFQTFVAAKRCTETNRRREEFIKYLKGKEFIRPKDFDPNQPYYEIAEHGVGILLDAIENPSPLAGEIFGSCDVFISHATGDTKAQELSQALINKKSDIAIYMTPELNPIEQGNVWPDDIIKHLKGAKIVAIVLTEESKNSPAVNQEIGYVLGADKGRIVWFSSNSPKYILLPGDIQEFPMSTWSAEQVAAEIIQKL